jgi:hypothetical protein
MPYCLKFCNHISIYIGTELNVKVYTDIKILTDNCLHKTHFHTKCLVELCERPTHCMQVAVSTLRTYLYLPGCSVVLIGQ